MRVCEALRKSWADRADGCMDGVGLQARDEPIDSVIAKDDRLDRRVVRKLGERETRAPRCIRWRGSDADAFTLERCGLLSRPIVERQLVAGANEILRDCIAHPS